MLIRAFIERQWLVCSDTDSVSELKERLATAWDMQATDMEYVNKNWQLLHKDINVDDDAQLHQIFADAIKRHLSSPNSDGRPEVIFKMHLMMTVVLAFCGCVSSVKVGLHWPVARIREVVIDKFHLADNEFELWVDAICLWNPQGKAFLAGCKEGSKIEVRRCLGSAEPKISDLVSRSQDYRSCNEDLVSRCQDSSEERDQKKPRKNPIVANIEPFVADTQEPEEDS